MNFRTFVSEIYKRVKRLSFRRKGNALCISGQESVGIVEFQQSRDNTEASRRFTVNVAVIYRALVENSTEIEGLKSMDGHVRLRLGMLLPQRSDKWWSLDELEFQRRADEIEDLIVRVAVPFLERHMSLAAAIELWAGGQSPGLTEGQRVRFLEKARRAMLN